MARQITITDEQILEAARAVFLKNGMSASTVEIARLAAVSEGSIFRRFGTKEALFRAAIRPPDMPFWVRELEMLQGQGDMRDNLMRIVRAIIRFAQERIPFAMLGWSHKPSPGAVPVTTEESPVERDRARLARFLQGEIDRGRLGSCQVDMVARLLLGPCLNLVLDSEVNKKPLGDDEIERFTAELVETLWQGIAPPPV